MKKDSVKRKFRFSDVGKLVGNSIRAIFRGEFLLRLKIDRYMVHIASCFMVVALTILVSLMIDTTLTEVETGRKVIVEQKGEIARREFHLAEISSRRAVSARLEKMGSQLKAPTVPAFTLGSSADNIER